MIVIELKVKDEVTALKMNHLTSSIRVTFDITDEFL